MEAFRSSNFNGTLEHFQLLPQSGHTAVCAVHRVIEATPLLIASVCPGDNLPLQPSLTSTEEDRAELKAPGVTGRVRSLSWALKLFKHIEVASRSSGHCDC